MLILLSPFVIELGIYRFSKGSARNNPSQSFYAERFKPQPEVAYNQQKNKTTQNPSWVNAEKNKESFVTLSTLQAEEQYSFLTAEAVFKSKGNALRLYVYEYLPTLQDAINTPQQLKELFLEKIRKGEVGRSSSRVTLKFGGLEVGVYVSGITGHVIFWLGDPGYELVLVNYRDDFADHMGIPRRMAGMFIRNGGYIDYLKYAIERLFDPNNEVNIREALVYTTKEGKGATAVIVVEKMKDNGKYNYVVGTAMFNREINVPFVGFAKIKSIPKIVEFGGLRPIGYPLDRKEFPLITGAGFDAKLANGKKGIVVVKWGVYNLSSNRVRERYFVEGIDEDSIEFIPYLTYYRK